MKRIYTVTLSMTLVALISATAAAAPSARELIDRSDRRHRIHFEKVAWTMILQKKRGKKRVRKVEVLRRQDPADKAGDVQRIRFLSPGDVKGTRLLTKENKVGSDRQWVYFPAFNQKRRIGAAELGDRFAGTDFNYEDLKRKRVPDYSYRMLREETFAGHDVYVIEATPKAPRVRKQSPYGRTVVWLRKDVLVMLKFRHFDRRGRPAKQILFRNWKKVSGKAWRPNLIVSTDIRRKHRTTVIVNHRSTPTKISADLLRPSGFADR